MEAVAVDGALDDGELARLVVEVHGHDEGEVEVAAIVEDGTAARSATQQVAAVGPQQVDTALGVGVLVAPDDDGALVAPEIERHLVGSAVLQQVVLDGEVPVGIQAGAGDEIK